MSDLFVSLFFKFNFIFKLLFVEKVPKPVNEASVVHMEAGLRTLAGVWTEA